ncbi:hypothetical protein [Zavarzinia sp.]|uniref:hypothetical protein n=1 Tax=Zavarzinia sp. TaxID=2027920 RepID=UPI00356723C1
MNYWPLLAGAMLLGACARDPNPASAGYFSGLGNVLDGTYDQRVAERQADAARAEQMAQEMQARAAQSRSEAAVTSAQVDALRARNAKQKAELNRLQAAYERARQNRNARAAELDAAQAQLDAARRRQRELEQHPPADPAERARQQAELDQQLKALDDLILHSTRAE